MTVATAPAVRASDRDRERTANQLGQALSQGYLAMDEYETRLQAAFAAHTTAATTRSARQPAERQRVAAFRSISADTWRWSSSSSRCGWLSA